MELKPLDSRLLSALADGLWLTRAQIAVRLRPENSTRKWDVLNPGQVAALEGLVERGFVERSWERTRGVNGRWIYKLVDRC